MTYVEGFLTPVSATQRDAYRSHAERAAPIMRELGVRRMVECWGDDVPRGNTNDLWRAVAAEGDDIVVFSWFEYPDKASRDVCIDKMMSDPRMEAMGTDMPFDGKRMMFGGFEVVSEAGTIATPDYVDGVVVPVRDIDGYRRFAERSAAIFLDHGALRVMDAVADDVRDGDITDFNRAVLRSDPETVAFGWVEWPDKAARDDGWAKVMADERMKDGHGDAFDGKRMIFGGFETLLDRHD